MNFRIALTQRLYLMTQTELANELAFSGRPPPTGMPGLPWSANTAATLAHELRFTIRNTFQISLEAGFL